MKDRKKTPNKEPMSYTTDKNGRRRFYAKCAICGKNKSTYVSKN